MKVIFIIPLYKPERATFTALLESLSAYPVICVENDGKFRKSTKNSLVYIHNPKNLGFAGGVNVGIARALTMGADWVTVVNQDVSVTQKAILAHMADLSEAVPCIRGPFGGMLDTKRWTTIVNEKRMDPLPNPDYISGSFLSIHRDVITRAGMLYEPYFMYYEDVDYAVRAKRKGFPIIATTAKGITHFHTAVLGNGSPTHDYYLARNHLLFVRRCAPLSVKWHEFVRMPKTLVEHKKRGEMGAIRGIRDFAINRFWRWKGTV